MKSPELTEFFSLLGKAKKEKKEEFDKNKDSRQASSGALISDEEGRVKDESNGDVKSKKLRRLHKVKSSKQ